MTTQVDHNKLLKKIAKERLKPHDIYQQGQSRTFLQDKGWYTIVIEFQPSSWSKGTYLNIGIDLHIYPRDHFAFLYGHREKGFEEFKDQQQFENLTHRLCDFIIKRVDALNKKFKDIRSAKKNLRTEAADETWRLYYFAVLNALVGDLTKAKHQLKKVRSEKCEHDWEVKRREVVDNILHWLEDLETFEEKMKNLIHETRQLKKLPAVVLPDLMERKPETNTWLRRLLDIRNKY